MSKKDTDALLPPDDGINKPNKDDQWKAMLVTKHTSHGEVLEPCSIANTITLIQYHEPFKDIFVLNEFSDEIIIHRCPPWDDEKDFKVRRVSDNDYVQCAAALEHMGLSPAVDKIRQSVSIVAEKNKFHPTREYFERLEWDGVERLKSWLYDYAGARDNGQSEEYITPIGMKWLVAAVKRVYEPGCKFDHMLVLEGKQNVGKSTLFRTLATIGPKDGDPGEAVEYFTDSVKFSNISDPGSIMKLQGVMIVEFSELAGMNRREIEDVKNWITIQTDSVQKKYKNEVTHYPRQFVLAGSTNEDTWLRDHTGNRRFFPVKCAGRLNIPGLRLVVEQLWAEAVWNYKEGFEVFIDYGSDLEKLATTEQTSRLIDDTWSELILDAAANLPFITVNKALELVGVEKGRRDETSSRRVGRILKTAGWSSKLKRHYKGGNPTRTWFNPSPKFENFDWDRRECYHDTDFWSE